MDDPVLAAQIKRRATKLIPDAGRILDVLQEERVAVVGDRRRAMVVLSCCILGMLDRRKLLPKGVLADEEVESAAIRGALAERDRARFEYIDHLLREKCDFIRKHYGINSMALNAVCELREKLREQLLPEGTEDS